MRDLTPDDLGILLSVFAVLLIFFGIDFRVSRTDATRHKRRALVFAFISLIGNAATAIGLILTWVALILPDESELVDTFLVFVPGSIAFLCALVLTGEVVTSRFAGVVREELEPEKLPVLDSNQEPIG